MSEPAACSRTQVRLHWVIVIVMAGQYLLHSGIEAAWQGRLDGTIPNAPFATPHVMARMSPKRMFGRGD